MRAALPSLAVLVTARFFVPVARAPDGILSRPAREPAGYPQAEPVHGIASLGPPHRTPVQGMPVQGELVQWVEGVVQRPGVEAWGASAVAVGVVAGTVAVAAVLGRTARDGRGRRALPLRMADGTRTSTSQWDFEEPEERGRRGSTPTMADGKRPGREMRWEAVATASEPCDASMAAFLAEGAKSDLILRVDESVVASEPADEPSEDGARRYRVSIAPLRLPGLTVQTIALIRVEAIARGVRYVTERCDNNFSGRFSRLVGSLPVPTIMVCTELRAREDGAFLDGRSDFSLVNPLPRWWPIPDRLMAAGGALIKRLVQRDTQLSVRRIVEECERARSPRKTPGLVEV